MKRWLVLSLLSLALVACRGSGLKDVRSLRTAQALMEALRSAGAAVEETSMAGEPAFSGQAHVIRVDGEIVHVVQYESAAARQADWDRIAADGNALGDVTLGWSTKPHLWACGQLIVVYPGTQGGVILLMSGLLGDPLFGPAAQSDEPYPPAITKAIGVLAERMDLSPVEINVESYDAVEWPDSCLGLPDPDEGCAQVLTSGWDIALRADGATYKFHTDRLGEQIRGLP